MHHGLVSTAAVERNPADWLDDVRWHRRMYRQSHFRWVPEDPVTIALSWTRGRVLHETPGHLRRLAQQQHDLHQFASGIDDAMVELLTEASQRCAPRDYADGLEAIGLSRLDVTVLRFHAQRPAPRHREAERAVRGIPLPNPFSCAWEMRQMRGMYQAAEDLLLDLYCDLILELVPKHGWRNVSKLVIENRTEDTLRQVVEDQRRHRGEPGDPRRQAEQVYERRTTK